MIGAAAELLAQLNRYCTAVLVIDGGTDVTVKVRPDTLIWLLIFTGVNFLYIWIKGKIAKKKAAKKAKTEAAQAAADTP